MTLVHRTSTTNCLKNSLLTQLHRQSATPQTQPVYVHIQQYQHDAEFRTRPKDDSSSVSSPRLTFGSVSAGGDFDAQTGKWVCPGCADG